jgi:hypothetical protein
MGRRSRSAFWPQHHLGGQAGHGDAAHLGDDGHRARRPRVGLQHVDRVLGWRTGCSSAPPRSAPRRSRVYSRMVSMCLGAMLMGGMTQAESPEWMPASSICSMTAGTKASVPSAMASASASMALSRNLSIRIGRSGESAPRPPGCSCCSISSSWTTSMPRPPST